MKSEGGEKREERRGTGRGGGREGREGEMEEEASKGRVGWERRARRKEKGGEGELRGRDGMVEGGVKWVGGWEGERREERRRGKESRNGGGGEEGGRRKEEGERKGGDGDAVVPTSLVASSPSLAFFQLHCMYISLLESTDQPTSTCHRCTNAFALAQGCHRDTFGTPRVIYTCGCKRAPTKEKRCLSALRALTSLTPAHLQWIVQMRREEQSSRHTKSCTKQ